MYQAVVSTSDIMGNLISFISGPDPEGITPVYYLGRDFTTSNLRPLLPNGLVQLGSVKFLGAVIRSGGSFLTAKMILHGCVGVL